MEMRISFGMLHLWTILIFKLSFHEGDTTFFPPWAALVLLSEDAAWFEEHIWRTVHLYIIIQNNCLIF